MEIRRTDSEERNNGFIAVDTEERIYTEGLENKCDMSHIQERRSGKSREL